MTQTRFAFQSYFRGGDRQNSIITLLGLARPGVFGRWQGYFPAKIEFIMTLRDKVVGQQLNHFTLWLDRDNPFPTPSLVTELL